MKKRIFAILLSALLMASATACNYAPDNIPENETESISTETDTINTEEETSQNNFDTSEVWDITVGYKDYLAREICKEMLTTVAVLSKNIDATTIDQINLRKILETLIPTECTLSEFEQVFPNYTITNEFYSDTRGLHIILVQLPFFEEIEFQFHCEIDTHDSRTHQTEFQLIAIVADFSVLFPEYSNLTVDQIEKMGEQISVENGSFLPQIDIRKALCYYRFNGTLNPQNNTIIPQGQVILNPFYYPSIG